MQNPIKQIVAFNEKAGLLGKGYNARMESAFQIEEGLEGFNVVEIARNLGLPEVSSAKDISRHILSLDTITPALPIVDAVDKACDAIVFAVGSLAKLGLDAQGITKALNIVMECNYTKLNNRTYDSEGKLLKDANFVGPEVRLKALLTEKGLV
jgi:hypothetical protein